MEGDRGGGSRAREFLLYFGGIVECLGNRKKVKKPRSFSNISGIDWGKGKGIRW